MEETTEKKEFKEFIGKKNYWSECRQIHYTYGEGFGLDEMGQTIYLGTEAEIEQFFAGGVTELSRKQRAILNGIENYRREKTNNDPSTSEGFRAAKPGNKRSGIAGTIKRGVAGIKRTKEAKIFSGGKIEP